VIFVFLLFCLSVPDGVLPPVLYSQTPSSVHINWYPPLNPNGVIIDYTVLRTVPGQTDPSAVIFIGTFPATDVTIYSYVDSSPDISPYTTYLYRVGASTLAGVTYSTWATITTMSSSKSVLLQDMFFYYYSVREGKMSTRTNR